MAPPRPWWGDGDAPSALWPGVTVDLPAIWSEDRGRWESPDGRFYVDIDAADRACDFFPDLLRHHIGEFAGKPFELLEYQKKLLTRPIFGWRRAADGLRRFRKVFAFLPKGAGKSPWGAGTGIYLARCDGEAAAEVYAVANDRQQARTVHDNAKIMIDGAPLLKRGCEILKDAIVWAATHSTYMVLSSEASTAHGKRPHGVIFDELHGQKNRDLYEALWRSMVKRSQPLLIIITHAGTDDEGICFEEYEYAKGVLSGQVADESCLPVIFEASADDDWTSPAVWRRVNPGHGITVRHDGIATACAEAEAEPRKLNDFLRFHLNRWVNQATAWIPNDWYDTRCHKSLPTDDELRQLPCASGLDLAQKWDLACFGVTFRRRLHDTVDEAEIVAEDESGRVAAKKIELNFELIVLPFFWIPEETLKEHEDRDGIPYSLYRDAGLLTATDGATIDYTRIYRDITEKILPRFPRLKQGVMGYDPAFATDIATVLRDRGGMKVAEVLQNYTHLSEICQIFEALMKAGRVVHGGQNRLLRSHVENVSVKRDDAGRIRPVKPRRAGKVKHIDGVVATLMAAKMLAAVPDAKKSIAVFAV